MPVGYLITVGLVATGVLLAVAPLRRRGSPGTVSFLLSAVVNESPFLAVYYVAAATLLALNQGDLDSSLGWAGLALAGVSAIGFPIIVRRSLRARSAVDRALEAGLGGGRRRSIGAATAGRPHGRLPWTRILLAPIPIFPPGVTRRANIPYGDAGRSNLLDVYRPRSRRTHGPILIHLHGGYFVGGRKSFEARPLLHRLARRGWVCISANYRLRPAATFPDYLIDVKKVIAWAREHADEYGADSRLLFVAGSSAGAHLAATAALTPNDPTFQPGFEYADTAVTAAIGLYGYYGPVDAARQQLPSSPRDYVRRDAPPVLIAHGQQDTFVAAEHARRFADELRGISTNPVVYVELPGGQHSFDLLHSIRFETLIDGIEAFAASVGSHAADGCPSAARRAARRPAAHGQCGTAAEGAGANPHRRGRDRQAHCCRWLARHKR